MAKWFDQQKMCVRGEAQPFDLWLALDLRERFGALETVPEAWIDMVDSAHPEE